MSKIEEIIKTTNDTNQAAMLVLKDILAHEYLYNANNR